MTKSKPKKQVVILGSGFGAIQTAKHLKSPSAQVTIVSPRNHFLFTPLLVSTTTGKVAFRNISRPIRTHCPEAVFRQAACTRIDPTAKTVGCESPEDQGTFSLSYDILVVAVGGDSSTFGIAGVHEHAVFLKELHHATDIRTRLLANLERAALPETSDQERDRLLHWVVVGGGPTGAEFAAELHDFITDIRREYPEHNGHIHITLLEAKDEILSVFDQALSDYAEERFRREGIDVRKQVSAKAVHAEGIELDSGEIIPCGLVVWSTGITPRPWIANCGLTTTDKGFLQTDDHCRVKGCEEVYAIGDCARTEGAEYPAAAQLAQQQGVYVGKTIHRMFRGKHSGPFQFRNKGMLASLGAKTAMADLPKGAVKGRVAWWIWRSVYFTKLVGWQNKFHLLGDWIHTRFFGRETSRFRP